MLTGCAVYDWKQRYKTDMLTTEEKAYCRGLEALQRREYAVAVKELEACKSQFAGSQNFLIIAEAATLLAQLEEQKQKMRNAFHTSEEIESHGEEASIRGQGFEEEAR